MTDHITLDIARLGAGGDGVADSSAGPIYVPRTLPGERIRADVRADRGRLISIERASPERATPPCPHFGSCGGCAAQHMSAGLYRDWKRDMVRVAFAHRGLEPSLDDVVMIDPGRRRRATFAASRRGSGVILGFHEEGSHTLVDISTCPVMLPAIERGLPGLRDISETVLTSQPDGSILRLAVTATPDGLDLALVGAAAKPGPQTQSRIAEIATRSSIIRVSADGHIVMQSARPHLVLGGAMVQLPPAAFIQATAEAEETIAGIISRATAKARHVADLFCGLGTFTFGLARRARVLAVDTEKVAIAALIAASKAAPGIKPIETRVRDLLREPLSRTELKDLDAVVLDPPRAGAKAQTETIAKARVPIVASVSCNPATLARDCRILVDAGYRIERVVPIDQFVWSPHVEAVAILRI